MEAREALQLPLIMGSTPQHITVTDAHPKCPHYSFGEGQLCSWGNPDHSTQSQQQCGVPILILLAHILVLPYVIYLSSGLQDRQSQTLLGER